MAKIKLTIDQRNMLGFAKTHDWGQEAQATDDGGVMVLDISTQDGVTKCSTTTLYTYMEMRHWAGY